MNTPPGMTPLEAAETSVLLTTLVQEVIALIPQYRLTTGTTMRPVLEEKIQTALAGVAKLLEAREPVGAITTGDAPEREHFIGFQPYELPALLLATTMMHEVMGRGYLSERGRQIALAQRIFVTRSGLVALEDKLSKATKHQLGAGPNGFFPESKDGDAW